MKRRAVQYAVFIGGTVLLCGGGFALALTRVIHAQSGLFLLGLFWLWTGLLLMLNQHPEFRRWDRREKQAYGFALAVMGGLWTGLSVTSLSGQWIPCLLSLIPPVLIAAVGRFWYVEKQRSKEYKKKQTEKD